MPYEVGAKVQLKTGGQNMTLEAVDGEKVTCIWFDKKGSLQRAEFLAATIEDVEHWDKLLAEIAAAKKDEGDGSSD
jgi:uncharacterized protein YodC (DUF2158 family)